MAIQQKFKVSDQVIVNTGYGRIDGFVASISNQHMTVHAINHAKEKVLLHFFPRDGVKCGYTEASHWEVWHAPKKQNID